MSSSSERLLLRWLLGLLLSCGLILPAAQAEREAQTPEELYGQAVKQLERGYFERSVELFEKLKTRYPFSQYAVLAELRLGDTHYQKAEYAEAIDAYRTFQKLHPRHPELDYVVYRIALSELKQSPKIAQRDQSSTRRMLAVLQNFEALYPQSKYTKEVLEMRTEGRKRLAQSVFGVGEHYYRRGRFELDKAEQAKAFIAARQRFEQVLDEYPDAEGVSAEALYWIGMTYVKEGNKAAAEQTRARLEQRYPKATQGTRLKARLARTRWPATAPKAPPASEPPPAPETPAAPPSAPEAPNPS